MSLQNKVTDVPGLSFRPAQLRGRVQVTRAFLALACALLFGIGVLFTWLRLNDLMALGRSGRSIEAQIFNFDHDRDLGNTSFGNIYFAFRPVRSQLVTGEVQVSREKLRNLRIGPRLQVTYLASNPRFYRLGHFGKIQAVQEAVQTLLLLGLAAAGLSIPFLLLERTLRSQLNLARYGTSAIGEITGCRPLARHAGFQVRYTVPLANGSHAAGQAVLPRRIGEPTLVGFPITVLYNVHNPRENRPLASFFWIRFV